MKPSSTDTSTATILAEMCAVAYPLTIRQFEVPEDLEKIDATTELSGSDVMDGYFDHTGAAASLVSI